MTKLRMKCGIACLLLAASAYAQTALRPFADAEAVRLNAPRSASLLRDLDSSLEQVVAKVSPAVVQIVVTGYGPLEDHGHSDTARIVRQHAIGAGVIVDPDGYIITNAHVVQGAQRIRVILPSPPADRSRRSQGVHPDRCGPQSRKQWRSTGRYRWQSCRNKHNDVERRWRQRGAGFCHPRSNRQFRLSEPSQVRPCGARSDWRENAEHHAYAGGGPGSGEELGSNRFRHGIRRRG